MDDCKHKNIIFIDDGYVCAECAVPPILTPAFSYEDK
jgi:hypothetical protein